MSRLAYSLLLPVLLFACAATSQAQDTHVVVLSGTAAPDGNGTIASVVSDPDDPDPIPGYGAVLNDAGQVAFTAYYAGTSGGQSDDSALLVTDGEALVQLLRAGDLAPDGQGTLYYVDAVTMPALDANGRVARRVLFIGGSSGDPYETGALTADASSTGGILVLREGDPSPDGDGTVQDLLAPVLTTSGEVALTVVIEDPMNPVGERAIVRSTVSGGAPAVIAREDEHPPNGDGRFSLLYGAEINDTGELVFQATIRSSTADDAAIYRVAPGSTALTKIVRVGDPALEGGEVVSNVITSGRNAINASGQVAFAVNFAPCTEGCVTTSVGVFRDDAGTRTEIARTGHPAPGGGEFVAFGVPGTNTVAPALNDVGQVAFFGEVLRGGNVLNGIYRGDGVSTVEIVSEGQAAPNGNGTFELQSRTSPAYDSNDVPKMNEQGQVAFFTNLRDTNTPALDDEGIFFYDDALGLLEVVRENDGLLGSPIREVRFTSRGSGAHDNARSGLNNLGQVAYAFQLADGRSGIAIWTPPSVTATPEAGETHIVALRAGRNPLRSRADIRFSLDRADEVTIGLYDVTGRRVGVRDLGRLGAGEHRTSLDASAIADGVYFARLATAEGITGTVRLVKAH